MRATFSIRIRPRRPRAALNQIPDLISDILSGISNRIFNRFTSGDAYSGGYAYGRNSVHDPRTDRDGSFNDTTILCAVPARIRLIQRIIADVCIELLGTLRPNVSKLDARNGSPPKHEVQYKATTV
jgi:hypothetical protein